MSAQKTSSSGEPHPLLPLLQAASPIRVLVFILVLIALLGLLYVVRGVSVPVLAAAGAAYVFLPLVDRLERRGIPRVFAIATLLLSALVVALGIIALVVPTLVAQLTALARSFPVYLSKAVHFIQSNFSEILPADGRETLEQGKAALQNIGPELLSAAGQVFRQGAEAVSTLVTIVLIPLFMFFFLKDWKTFADQLFDMLPRPMQAPVHAKVRQIDQTLSAYLHGVLTIATILAVIYSIGLSILGVPMGLLIGVVAGYAYIVPFMSSVLGVSFSVLLCLLEFSSWGQIAGVLVLFLIGNTIEGLFLTPRIVGDSLGLPPIAVILAVMVGGHLFGFLGILLALPMAAIINVTARDLLVLWKTSAAYATGLESGSNTS